MEGLTLRLFTAVESAPAPQELLNVFSKGGEESRFTVIHLSLICNDCSICCMWGGL